MLHRAKKMNPDAVVVAVGCYVQTDEEGVRQDEAIDLAIGNNRKKDLVEILARYLGETENTEPEADTVPGAETANTEPAENTEMRSVIDINHTSEYEEMVLKKTAEHTRAYIKIQDGCNQFCTYCIIPYARGRVRSRREEDIIGEVEGIVAAGYQEIVLTGIHISSYGMDRGGSELLQLLHRLHEIEGLKRIRLGSLEPRIVTEEFAEQLSKMPKICPHFHLSLQSGCDAVLKRMNRHYDSREYFRTTELLRKYYEDPALTTDVIVGFPQETDEEFRETEAFVRKAAFAEVHIFKYSKRKGTLAAEMEGQITEAEKARRSRILIEAGEEMTHAYRQNYIGKQVEVLFETRHQTEEGIYWIGHTPQYVKVAKVAADAENLGNQLIKGRVTDFLDDELLLME
jgi:threonylcarbamoyladenosine tRNA methylthiotransferase MtaB